MGQTSMKVSENTYKTVIKTRGIFEQLFGKRLTLDETVYLSSRTISLIYEIFQKLDAQGKIKIVDAGDGSLRLDRLEVSDDVFQDIIEEITEINDKLAEKEKEKLARLTVPTER